MVGPLLLSFSQKGRPRSPPWAARVFRTRALPQPRLFSEDSLGLEVPGERAGLAAAETQGAGLRAAQDWLAAALPSPRGREHVSEGQGV